MGSHVSDTWHKACKGKCMCDTWTCMEHGMAINGMEISSYWGRGTKRKGRKKERERKERKRRKKRERRRRKGERKREKRKSASDG